MWYPRIASASIYGIGTLVLLFFYGVIRVPVVDSFFDHFEITGLMIAGLGHACVICGIGGVIASFGLTLTPLGTWEPKQNLFGRLIGFITRGSESYCAAATSTGFALILLTTICGYAAFEVGVLEPVFRDSWRWNDLLHPEVVKIVLGPFVAIAIIMTICACFMMPFGRRHMVAMGCVPTALAVALVVWQANAGPSVQVLHFRLNAFEPYGVALTFLQSTGVGILFGVILPGVIIVALQQTGYYNLICPIAKK